MSKRRNNLIAAAFVVAMAALSIAGCAHMTETGRGRNSQPRGDATLVSAGKPPFTFVVIGDARPGIFADPDTEWSPSIHYMEHILWINRIKPDFTINVGDSVRGYNTTTKGLLEKQWDGFDEAGRLFKQPYFMVAGNHDAWDEYAIEIYNRRYGPLYYSFDHKECHYTVLSAELPKEANKIGPQQLKWLEKDLENAQNARCRFVFIHRPLWSPTSHFMPSPPAQVNREWMTTIHPLLLKRKVDTVFGGHDHLYQFDEVDGIRYIVTGGGGAELNGTRAVGGFRHFLRVTVPAEGRPEIKVVERLGEYPQDVVRLGSMFRLRETLKGLKFGALTTNEPEPQIIGFTISNAFERAVTFAATWSAEETNPVRVDPKAVKLVINPGVSQNFAFKVGSIKQTNGPACSWSLDIGGQTLAEETRVLRVLTDEKTEVNSQ